MRAIRRRDSTPELSIRSRLHALGLRFRVDFPIKLGQIRPIRPDVAFTRVKLAVFVDGCFWHGCPEHGRRQSIKNGSYWESKLARNYERDSEQTAALTQAGWKVIRIWEHEDPDRAALEIAQCYRQMAG